MFLGLLIFLIIANQKSSAAFLNVDQTIPDDKKECILKCSIGSHQIDYGCFGKCMYHLPNDFQLKTTIKKDAGDNKRNVVRSETLAPLAEVKSTSRGVELFRGLPDVFGAQLSFCESNLSWSPPWQIWILTRRSSSDPQRHLEDHGKVPRHSRLISPQPGVSGYPIIWPFKPYPTIVEASESNFSDFSCKSLSIREWNILSTFWVGIRIQLFVSDFLVSAPSLILIAPSFFS